MAQILDKQGLQHYANKMCNADNRKVGSKNLPTALNEIDIAIDGFKTLFETEYGTPVNMELENNENVFSIGTGTNVDKRSEIENSFTDVELSGNSLVNIAKNNWSISTGRQYITLTDSLLTINLEGIPTGNITGVISYLNIDIVEGKTYTFLIDIIENTIDSNIGIDLNGKNGWNHLISLDGKKGKIAIKYTPSGKGNSDRLMFRSGNTSTSGIFKVVPKIVVLEGDWTNKPIPQYFEGLKSVGEKEDGNHKISISSVGKNLFEPTVSQKSSSITANTQYSIENNGYSISISSSVNRPTTETASHIHFGEVKLKIGETYVVSADKMIKDTNTAIPQIRIAYWDKQNNRYATIGYLTNHTSVFTFTVESGKEYVALGLYSHGALLTNGQTVKATYEGVRLYLKSTSNTSYEPHKSDKKEILLNEPLRGLPNGIKDTIEKVNGEWKIVRRCGEVVLDGNRTWTIWSNNTDGQNLTYNAYVYSADLDITKKTTSDSNLNVINDKVTNHYRSFIDRTGESIIVASSIIHLSILRTKLETQDTTGLKKWLSQNPIKVVYELATPIIEDVSPATLQCWKNGTIYIDEVLPVESTHTVALNKSAQIQKNIEELSILRNRIEALEKQYNNSTLNQAYELELLRLDMQLDNII